MEATTSGSSALTFTFLLAGQRREAIQALETALRQEPTNGNILHIFGLVCFHTARLLESQGYLLEANAAWERTIATWAALFQLEPYWEQWRVQTAGRYQASVSSADVRALRKQTEEHLVTLLASTPASAEDITTNGSLPCPEAANRHRLKAWLFQRELKAAELLNAIGGFPLPNEPAQSLVCGPLLMRLLTLERAFGSFIQSALLDKRLPDLTRQQQLRRYFSQLGMAQSLLDADRAQEALEALSYAICPRCRAEAMQWKAQVYSEADWLPLVCADTCPDFEALNPSYAGRINKGRDLWADAVELAIEAHLNLSQPLLARENPDVQAIARHWDEAVRLSRPIGQPEPTQRRIVEMVLGRIQVLKQKVRLDEAIALLEAAVAVCDDYFDRELVGRLSEMLTERGITAGNQSSPAWEAVVADLRRAARYNPHTLRPVLNLSIALQRWAAQRHAEGEPRAAADMLAEAVQFLQSGWARMPGHPELIELYKRVLIDYGNELSHTGQYERAEKLFEMGLQEFPGDVGLTIQLTNLRLTMVLRGSKHWYDGIGGRST